MSKTWTLTDSQPVLDTKWLRVDSNRYELPSGDVVDDYYVVSRDDFVMVAAIEGDRIILVEQYRPATDELYWSLPAGYLDGEDPVTAGRRELEEETGLRAGTVETVAALDPLPGYLRSTAHIVLARDLSGELGTRDPDEISAVASRPIAEVLDRVRNGDIREMQAAVSILMVADLLNRDNVTKS